MKRFVVLSLVSSVAFCGHFPSQGGFYPSNHQSSHGISSSYISQEYPVSPRSSSESPYQHVSHQREELPSYGSSGSYLSQDVQQQYAVEQPSLAVSAPVRPKVHEIHSHSQRQLIRLEEYGVPQQVIRVHENAQAAPQIIKIKAPAEAQSLIRVVSKSSGPAQVQRFVHKARGVQVFNVQKPSRSPVKIIHVVREAAPAPKVEFIDAPGQDHHVYVARAPAAESVSYNSISAHEGHHAVAEQQSYTAPSVLQEQSEHLRSDEVVSSCGHYCQLGTQTEQSSMSYPESQSVGVAAQQIGGW